MESPRIVLLADGLEHTGKFATFNDELKLTYGPTRSCPFCIELLNFVPSIKDKRVSCEGPICQESESD